MTEEQVFLAALDLADPADRMAYLEKACGADAEFLRQVEDLLAAHFKTGAFLNEPAGQPMANSTPAPGNENNAGEETVAGEQKSGKELDDLHFLQPPTRSDSLGRIGHYEVLQLLGRGGFGIVLRAFDDVLQRVVALKVLAAAIAATSPARKRFLREARASAQVRHENVVHVYAVEEQPLPYLVMEFIPGETLQQRLDRTGPLETSEILRLGRQIAEGLAAAHATGLIHRDIKPGNVLIEEGTRERVKITDFGLARAADDASQTQSGVLAGTPMYMAPEQAKGERLDHRADLFSLGSVIYVMASGRPPFRAATTFAVLKRVVEEAPRSIQEIIPEVPQWLCDIIARLQAKKPADRFQSAREVADLLADWEAKLKLQPEVKHTPPVAAVQPAAPVGRTSSTGRMKWVVAAAALLLPVFALALTEIAGVTHLFRDREATPLAKVVTPKQDYPPAKVVDTPKRRDPPAKVDPIVPADENDRDRRAAEYALSIGGTVRINGADRDVGAVTELPQGPLRVTDVNLRFNKKVTDAGLAAFANCTNVTLLSLGGCTQLTDAGLAHFKDCKGLTVFRVEGVRLTDTGLAAFKNCDLTHLNLNNTQVTDDGLAYLKDCKNLTMIQLLNRPVTDAGLANLKDCKSLTLLDLRSTGVTDAGLAYFKDCNLTVLSLGDTSITNTGLAVFKDCKNLMNLELARTSITDAGLAFIKDCKDLRYLHLNGTQTGDAGLAHVKDCKDLKTLTLQNTKVSAAGIETLKKALPGCRMEWDGGVIEPKVGFAPFSDADVKRIAALPAAEQVEEVRKELKRRNPDFEGALTPTIEDGVVTGLAFSTEQVSDVAPVRALTNLTNLKCTHGKLSDLSPLKGLKLATLDLSGTQVADLAPLQGMPLTSLRLHTCRQIRDVTPLQGMPLTYLSIHDGPKVVDFSPLQGMPLTRLSAGGNPVRDLSPLKGLPLTRLILSHCHQLQDLSPLKGLPLTWLTLDDTPVRDLEPLKDMPLKTLYIDRSGVTDLTPLQAMELEDIRLTPKSISQGLDILHNMKSLKTIGLSYARAWPAAEFWARHDKGEFKE